MPSAGDSFIIEPRSAMVNVALFDLGLTLVDANRSPFPHVEEALEVIGSFTTKSNKPLLLGLVSDSELPEPPPTKAKVAAIFARYLTILEQTGLRSFFEPVERRVTLSAHAGVSKPAREIFDTALRRLRSKSPLQECLLVTENGEHIRAVRSKLKMKALQFRSSGSPTFDFDDWRQAPAMIAHLVDPDRALNLETALRSYLRREHEFEVNEIEGVVGTGPALVRGRLWKPVGARAGHDLADVRVPFTVEGEIERGPAGEIKEVRFARPDAEAVTEAASFVRSLAHHGDAADSAAPRARASTHVIETDDQGHRRLVRKRFSAL